MTGRWLQFIFVLSFIGCTLTSQAQQTSPLHKFFQQNFDSTLIYQSGSNADKSPNYLILAKYQDQLEFFTYTNSYHNALGHYYPGKLSQKFMKEELLFSATLPDTNRYLLPKRVASETLRHSWQQLHPHLLWVIEDDRQTQHGSTSSCIIEDADEHTFYLIQKHAIRVAHFTAPEFYEQCAGPDSNRQQAIQARNTLQALLRQVR